MKDSFETILNKFNGTPTSSQNSSKDKTLDLDQN